MTSPSLLSRESTTRSSAFPQYGHRMTRRISRFVGAACLLRQLLPVQSFAEKQQQSGDDDGDRSDEVKEHGHGDGAVDVETVKRREDVLTDLVESADARSEERRVGKECRS